MNLLRARANIVRIGRRLSRVSLSNTARWNQTIHRRFSRRSLTFIWIKIRRRRCHENASDCLRLDRCGGDAGDTGTCLLLTRLPSRRTMSRVQRSVPAILRSSALLWSTATLRSGAVLRFAATIWSALLRLRLGQPTWRSSTAGNSSTRELMREWTHVLALYQGKDSYRERNYYSQSIHRAAASAGLVRSTMLDRRRTAYRLAGTWRSSRGCR